MMNTSRMQKRKLGGQRQSIIKNGKHKHLDYKLNFISMSEARQIAEHVFSGIAWSG